MACTPVAAIGRPLADWLTVMWGSLQLLTLLSADISCACSNITFENITAQAVHQVGDWWGAAEALYITSIPRYTTTKVQSSSQCLDAACRKQLPGEQEGLGALRVQCAVGAVQRCQGAVRHCSCCW